MSTPAPTVVFLGNGRCYHTMDWFRSAQAICPDRPPVLVTDLIDGESFSRLIQPADIVERLLVIDRVLFRTQSRAGDIWRNAVKLILLPVQVLRLRQILKRYSNPVLHAHSMYYIAVACFSGCRYVATPQGSEVLARPYRSRAYREFARVALFRASRITVDSVAMQSALMELYGLNSILIQNGIDLGAIRAPDVQSATRAKVVSIRGLVPNYQIAEILAGRGISSPNVPLSFCYPFSDDGYRKLLARQFGTADRDLGRLTRAELYDLLHSAKLVISIPLSDSSPRSVYEAIFCGCIVATTSGNWIDQLPECMRSRVIVIDVANKHWFHEALDYAEKTAKIQYVPSPEALKLFDQRLSMQRIYDAVYPAVARS